jgi:hypothetical protein
MSRLESSSPVSALTEEQLITKLTAKIKSVETAIQNQTYKANSMSEEDRLANVGKKSTYEGNTLQLNSIHKEMKLNLQILKKAQESNENCVIISNKFIITSKENRGTFFITPSSESFYDYDQHLELRINKALTVRVQKGYKK